VVGKIVLVAADPFIAMIAWDNLERYPEDGLFSVRVHVYVNDSESESLEAGKTFVRQLFSKVLSWRRF
jgi:hypothetical protein